MKRPSFCLSLFVMTMALLMGSMACQRKLAPQASCQFMQNKDVQRVSWKLSGLPIPIYIHQSVPPEAYPSIEEAMQVYRDHFGREVFTIRGYGTSGPAVPKKDGYSVIYWLDTWEEDRLNEQGRTTVYWAGDVIYEADMRINNSSASHLQFHYAQAAAPVKGVDLKSLFVHEFGHMLGLDHNSHSGSIMNTQLASGTTRTTLSSEDQANLNCEYLSP